MKNLLRNNRGAAAIEFGLACLPVLLFMVGIIQTGWVVWVDNLLHVSVDYAARCGAVNSTTAPCTGGSSSNMITTANAVFGDLSGATFTQNTTSCSGAGLIGTYTLTIGFVFDLTITAKSCYPTVVVPS